MKLSGKLPWRIFSTLTPSTAYQEHPSPARLQEETWRIGRVLTSFLMMDLDETFCKASLGYFEYSDPISISIKNIPVLQDSRKRLGGYMESWQACWCLILMKLSVKLPRYILSPLNPPLSPSRTSLSSKAPGRDLDDRGRLDELHDVGSWWNFL